MIINVCELTSPKLNAWANPKAWFIVSHFGLWVKCTCTIEKLKCICRCVIKIYPHRFQSHTKWIKFDPVIWKHTTVSSTFVSNGVGYYYVIMFKQLACIPIILHYALAARVSKLMEFLVDTYTHSFSNGFMFVNAQKAY